MELDCAFPGGNIVIERVDGSDVFLHQDIRDTAIDWFYWCLRVRGAAGRRLRFIFTESPALGVRGPAISVDAGRTWAWLGRGVVDGNAFQCDMPGGAHEVRLSFAMPYQQSHWRAFMAELENTPTVRQDRLCVTEKGRDVECLTLRCRKKLPEHRVAITCRHHCCEMMANYVIEGLVRWILADAEAGWLRDNVEFLFVPFVDKDGVEDGDQGKARKPRDHGRDYEGNSIYASTRAIRERIPRWSNGRLRVGLDIHCPHISGQNNEALYLVGSADKRIAAGQKRFSDLLEAVSEGPLPFSAKDFLPFGQSWNTGANYASGKMFSSWAAELPEVALATSIEVPYANVGGMEVNQESAGAFGMDLGRGLTAYLRDIRLARQSRPRAGAGL